MRTYDPTDPMGYMPELPSNDDMKDIKSDDAHLLGCMIAIEFLVVIAACLIAMMILKWLF